MIAINNATQVAEFAYCTELLSDRLIGRGYVSYGANSSTHTLIDAPVPSPWIGGGYDWDGNVLTLNQYGQDNYPHPPLPSLEDYDKALTAHLDAVAQSRRWQDRISLMARAGFPGPWQADAIAFGQWADTCNSIGYAILADFQAGNIPQPTVQEVLDALPEMVWPVV